MKPTVDWTSRTTILSKDVQSQWTDITDSGKQPELGCRAFCAHVLLGHLATAACLVFKPTTTHTLTVWKRAAGERSYMR